MKNNKIIIIFALSLVIMIFFSGCEQMTPANDEHDQNVETTFVYDSASEEEYSIFNSESTETIQETVKPVVKFQVDIYINIIENLFFSKYDVDFYIDNEKICTMLHGTADEFQIEMIEGEHTLGFTKAGDNNINGETILSVYCDSIVNYEIYCHNDEIKIEEYNGQKDTINSSIVETDSTIEEDCVYYSTNDFQTAKNGNTGVFAYKNKGTNYDNYYIIDFDEGVVYYFTYGNSNIICDRINIVSGDLNDVLVITWHDVDGSSWSEGLHFKRKNQPDLLIVQDSTGFEYTCIATDLQEALSIRDTMQIVDY